MYLISLTDANKCFLFVSILHLNIKDNVDIWLPFPTPQFLSVLTYYNCPFMPLNSKFRNMNWILQLEEIRYSQGTTEELRFFSLLLSFWALKHSTKRRLH